MRAYLILPPGTEAEAALTLFDAADALVFDAKAAAAIAALAPRPERPRLLARLPAIDSPAFGAHLEALIAARPDALVLPVAHGRDVADLGARLAVGEAEHGLPDGGLAIVALVAGAAGALAATSLVGASPRLAAFGWDASGLAAGIGAPTPWAGDNWIPPLAQARALVRLTAAAAGLPAIDAAPGDDAPGCRQAIAAARRDGFSGLFARGPAQAALIRAAG